MPEPEPDSLDEKVDWMTYSHPELYSMIHSGLDLTGAMSVSAKWARLGDELAEIGDELTRLLNATYQAWQGEAADLAQGSVSALADWSGQTGIDATEVSACITVQVDNANTARNNMPAPPYPVDPGPDLPHVPDSATAFTTGDFGAAQTVVTDPMVWTRQEQALHQQAAQTMEQFQANSREVYGTVPQFAPPDLRRMPFTGPGPDPEPPPQPQPQPPTPTAPQQTTPGAPGAPAVSGGGGVYGGVSVGGGGQPAATATPAPQPGAGGAVGAGPGAPGQQPAAASAGKAGTPGGFGGMPMGGMGGGRGGEDSERKGPKYLEEDEDLWGGTEKVTPPVIGEDKRRA